MYCSAAVCPSWVWPSIRKYLGVSDVITGYGMTEVCGASMQTAPDDGDEILESRVGKLLPGGCSGEKAYGRTSDRLPCSRPENGEKTADQGKLGNSGVREA